MLIRIREDLYYDKSISMRFFFGEDEHHTLQLAGTLSVYIHEWEPFRLLLLEGAKVMPGVQVRMPDEDDVKHQIDKQKSQDQA